MSKKALCWNAIAVSLALALAGCSHEGADWKSATAADTSEAYQQFLTQHPNSANAVQAHTRIQQLQEDRDWQAATSADTRDGYEQFLTQHADSKWAQEARIRIENFAQSGGAAAANAAAAARASAPAAAAAKSAAAPPSMATGGGAGAEARQHAASTAATQYVQLGAFSSQARAESQWKLLKAKYSRELAALTPRYVAGKGKPKHLVRLQVGVASRAAALGLCEKLKKHAQSCVPVSAG
ncbi:MAG TPA: SPOR domain-containing protein [Steroidobacteraceae bacterium]